MDAINLHIDLRSLQGTFFRRLQHQLDRTKVLQVGCAIVTEEQVNDQADFGAFVPANGAQLDHEHARAEAQGWLLRGFLRDAIEETGLFLDECLHACQVMPFASRGTAKAGELHHLINVLPGRNHRLHFPQKLELLEREFGVCTPFNTHVLSINKARTCLVHRLGTVSSQDVDDSGVLKILFQHSRFVARGQVSGQELLIDRPGIATVEDSILELQFVDNERLFNVGERIELRSIELYDTIITLWRFGVAAAQAVEQFGRSVGLEFPTEEVANGASK
jgi:hypothetical protein